MRLSRKAWNNVLIFGVLGFVLIVHGLNFGERERGHARLELIPTDALILTLDYPQLKLERIGAGWRSNRPNYSEAQAHALQQQWLGLSLTPLQPNQRNDALKALRDPSAVVRILLAGQAEPVTVLFSIDDAGAYVASGDLIGRLDRTQLSFLFPPSN